MYKTEAEKWGIKWTGRNYDPNDFSAGDKINQALSAGNVCLYGVAHAVIAALGCSPGLGFIHVGHECSFVYDIADLYKAEITIPVAFETVAEDPEDLPGTIRRKVRDRIAQSHLIERMVHDIRYLLLKDDEQDEIIPEADVTYLWDSKKEIVSNGKNYTESE